MALILSEMTNKNQEVIDFVKIYVWGGGNERGREWRREKRIEYGNETREI